MRNIFGDIKQLGFVSRDIDRSMKHFVEAWGVGPWYVLRQLEFPALVRGENVVLNLSIALSHSGDLQFEIIQQHNETPSVYLDALAKRPGLHLQHFAVWSDDCTKVRTAAESRGWQVAFSSMPGPGESSYIVHPDGPEICMEISDRCTWKESARNLVRECARDWNGDDPIREGLPDQPEV